GVVTRPLAPSSYNPASLALLKYLPSGGTNGNFTFVQPSFTNYGEVTARFDQDLGSKDRFTARYFSDGYHLDGVLNLQDLLTYADLADLHYYNALIAERHTFNSHILNTLTVS